MRSLRINQYVKRNGQSAQEAIAYVGKTAHSILSLERYSLSARSEINE